MAQEMIVTEFRSLKKGASLQGFLTLTLPSGMVLHDCTLHEREDGARWVGMPARQYTKADGETAWSRIVDFSDKAAHQRFQEQARRAIDKYFAQQPDHKPPDSTMITDANVNF